MSLLPSKQLFLSKRIVTEDTVFDGGILVDENGIIAKLLNRKEITAIIEAHDGKLKVSVTVIFKKLYAGFEIQSGFCSEISTLVLQKF